MKKLQLALEDLGVQSFSTMPDPPARRGTVRANSDCMYTGDYCSAYWSTCGGGGDDTVFCPWTGVRTCGCSDQPETCAAPCAVSDMTDCHRCG